ncbi:MAG: hypothetical protein QF464_14525 [Myxococcota bacterium]|nr:hypothetical protein [Myxococcota bacterium]
MERLLGFAINDTSFLEPVVKDHGAIFDVARGLSDGGWGLGVHRHGEMLVQKRRVSASIDSEYEVITSGARHSVLHAAPRQPGLFDLEQVQPHRYRNWLFAAAGAYTLPSRFVAETSRVLQGFTAEGRWMACPVEGIMLLYMHALHSVGELDRVRPHTRALRRAMVAGTTAVTTLLGGPDHTNLALVLHVRNYTYAMSLGRRVSLKSLYPTGDTYGSLGRPGRHVRAVAVMNDAPAGWGEDLSPWSMIEIGPDAGVEACRLDV